MKLIKPSVAILPYTGNIYEDIEMAGRTCYKSESAITETSAPKFVQMLIDRGHTAMLEHGTVYLKQECNGIMNQINPIWRKYESNKYSKVIYYNDLYDLGINSDLLFSTAHITTNYRVLVENGWLDDLQYQCSPTEFHEKRISVRFICDRGVSHELVRHRVFSFAQESTRYCNYSKDKFGNQLTFIIPCWMNLQEGSYECDWDIIDDITYWGWYNGVGNIHIISDCFTKGINDAFLSTLAGIEESYFSLLEKGWQPQQARSVLPNSLKTEIVMTGFVSDWKHFFDLRDSNQAHPQMRELAIPLQKMFIDSKLIES